MKARFDVVPGERVFTNYQGAHILERFAAVFNRLEPGTDTNTGDRSRPHAFSYTKSGGSVSLNGSMGQTVRLPDAPDQWWQYAGAGIQSFLNSPILTFEDRAYNACLEKVNNAIRGNVDLSIDLLDARKGIEMVKQMWYTVKSARRLLDRLEGTKNPREAGSLWLEWQYGWKPTAQTIYECLEQLLSPNAEWLRVREYASDKRTISGSAAFPGKPGWTRRVRIDTNDRCEMNMVFGPQSGFLQAMGRYTSLNPLSIAYERFPFSFVLDWVVDIGGYLRNVETAIIYGSRFRSGYVTRTIASTVDESIGGSNQDNGNTTSWIDCSGSQWARRKERYLVTAYPSPRLPSIDPQFGTSRLISAASLLAQQVKSWEPERIRVPRR